MIKVSLSERRSLAVATAIALVVFALFLRPYFILIAFAAILAFSFNGVYKKFRSMGSKPGKAASLTFVIALMVIVIPVIGILTITTFQIASLIESISGLGNNVDLNELLQSIVDWLNSVMSSIGINHTFTVNDVTSAISSGLSSFSESFLQGIRSSLSGFIGFFSSAIIFIYVFVSLLKNQDKLLDVVSKLNPLGSDIGKLYIERMGAMTKAMVKGQFVIATAQGFTDALLIYLAGIHQGFLFFFLILTALSIIPLGGGILVIPMGIIMILIGEYIPGIILLAGHLLIVTNIDNVLRPKLVPENAKLDPALTLLAVFAGLKFFGFLGIILGPVLMIVIVTTIQVYLDVYKETEFKISRKPQQGLGSVFHKAKTWSKNIVGRNRK